MSDQFLGATITAGATVSSGLTCNHKASTTVAGQATLTETAKSVHNASTTVAGQATLTETAKSVHNASTSLLAASTLKASPTVTSFFKPVPVPMITTPKIRQVIQAPLPTHSTIQAFKPLTPKGTTVKVQVKR